MKTKYVMLFSGQVPTEARETKQVGIRFSKAAHQFQKNKKLVKI